MIRIQRDLYQGKMEVGKEAIDFKNIESPTFASF